MRQPRFIDPTTVTDQLVNESLGYTPQRDQNRTTDEVGRSAGQTDLTVSQGVKLRSRKIRHLQFSEGFDVDARAEIATVAIDPAVTDALQVAIDGKQPLDADLTTIAGLGDPGADRILFWDDSAGAYAFLEASTNLTITGTAMTASGGGGGAPTTATYITQTADAGLSAEQALSSLATGIVKNTTGTGVLSIATAGTDYYNPGGTDVAVADGGTGASTAANARTNLELVAGAAGDIWVEKAGDTMTGALVINVNTAGALKVQNGSGVDTFLFDALNDQLHGHSGADIILYSDAGTTATIGMYGNNGNITFGTSATADVTIRKGSGSPEAVVTAAIGSLFLRSDGSTDTSVYRKESGTGNTGWVAVSSSGSGLTHPQVISRLWLVG